MAWVQLAVAALGAMKGSTKQSGAGATSLSGQGSFGAENEISTKKPMIDFANPLHVGAVSVGLIVAIVLFKKFKGK